MSASLLISCVSKELDLKQAFSHAQAIVPSASFFNYSNKTLAKGSLQNLKYY